MSKYFTRILHHIEVKDTICFKKEATDEILKSIKLGHSESPIVVVSVFAQAQQKYRELFTNWLIHYFENESRDNKDCEKVSSLGNPEYFLGGNSKDGIYLWNKTYEVPFSCEAEKRICLVMYHVGSQPNLKDIALNVCTHAILFGDIEQDKHETLKVQNENITLGAATEKLHITKLEFDPNNTEETIV